MPSSVSAHRLSGGERDVGAPHARGRSPPATYGRQRVLAGVAARAVAAVVAERDRLGERDVEAERPGDRRGHLGDLEGVGEPGALVVVGEHEHLGLAGQAAERGGVQDAVAVAFEAGAARVGLLLDERGRRRPMAWVASGASVAASSLLACARRLSGVGAAARPTSRRGRAATLAGDVAGHRRRPALRLARPRLVPCRMGPRYGRVARAQPYRGADRRRR